MHTHVTCRKWSLWSYQIRLRQPLAVLGGEGLLREGFILGRFNKVLSKWLYGEISPLPSFHNIKTIDVYNDIINTVRNNKKPQTALVKTVFDVWNTFPTNGIVSVNSLLNSNTSTTNTNQHTIKIKLGRQSLDDDIAWFTHLQQQYPSVQWRLDCNRQWTVKQLLSFWQTCGTKSIQYIEDPLENPAFIEKIADIPLALDESLLEYQSLLAQPNVVAAIIKPTLHFNWQHLLAKYPGINGVISSTFESSLGIWGLGQLALRYAPDGTHGLGTLDWFAEDCVNQPLQRTINELYLTSKSPSPLFSKLHWEDGE